MASKPDKPPESIIVGQFDGLKNTSSPERLTLSELEAAVNVDIDDVGQLRRRRGRALVAAGSYHSVKTVGDTVYGVKDGALGVIYPDYSFSTITQASADPISYTRIADVVYYSSVTVSGKIVNGAAQAWGQIGGDGTWLSPVVNPTATLGAISGKLLGPPPQASLIDNYNGRIYLADERTLWVTQLYLYDLVDRTRGLIQFEHDITLLAAVDDGIYVGTTGALYFLSGTAAEGLKRRELARTGVIRGSDVRVPANRVHPAGRQGPVPKSDAVVFLTAEGVHAGFNGGECYNLTDGKVVFPDAASAAALYREQDGVNQYVAVADSAGTPSSNTRIGDYVDAEIRRFQGG